MPQNITIEREDFHRITFDIDDLIQRRPSLANPAALQELKAYVTEWMNLLPDIDAEEGPQVTLSEGDYATFRTVQAQVRNIRQAYLKSNR